MIVGVLGLIYRSTLYWNIPVEPGEPYGYGDVLDGLFGLMVLALFGVTTVLAVVGLIVPRFRDFGRAARAEALTILACFGYFYIHSNLHRLF
jgi:uncharacterized membrane protein YhaH (DUF805 family)